MKTSLTAFRFIGLFFLLSLKYSASFSQGKEFKGYYINLSGDTVKGVIAGYKQWNFNPAKINFIPEQTAKMISLTPLNCMGFNAEGYDSYISYQGKRMTNPIEFGLASSDYVEDVYDTVSTFLRQIAETGKYRFYVYKDKVRINLFYANSDNVITELIQKASFVDNKYWESMAYKQQLKELFNAGTQKENADNVRYSEESLSEFVNSQYPGNKYKKIKNEDSQIWILGGASFNSFKFSGDKTTTFSQGNYSFGIAPVSGIASTININRNFGKMFLFPQLKIYSYNTSAKINNSSVITTNTFKASPIITLGLNVGYNVLNQRDLKAFFAAGAGIISLRNNKHTSEVRYNATSVVTSEAQMRTLTYFVNVNAGFIVKRKYMGWLSYNLPMAVTNYVYTTGNLSVVQIGIGYKL